MLVCGGGEKAFWPGHDNGLEDIVGSSYPCRDTWLGLRLLFAFPLIHLLSSDP